MRIDIKIAKLSYQRWDLKNGLSYFGAFLEILSKVPMMR